MVYLQRIIFGQIALFWCEYNEDWGIALDKEVWAIYKEMLEVY